MTDTRTTSFDALERTDYWCVFDGISPGDQRARIACAVDQYGYACFCEMPTWVNVEVGGFRSFRTDEYEMRAPWQLLKRALQTVIDSKDGEGFSMRDTPGKLLKYNDDQVAYAGECGATYVFDVAVMQALVDWLV